MANDLNLILKNYAVFIANFLSDIHTYPLLVVPVPNDVSALPVPAIQTNSIFSLVIVLETVLVDSSLVFIYIITPPSPF